MQAPSHFDEAPDRAASVCPPAGHFPDADRSDRNPADHRRSGQTGAATVPAGIEGTAGAQAVTAGWPGRQTSPRPIGRLLPRGPGRLVCIVGLSWLVFLGIGFYSLAREEFTPVESSVSTVKFPPSTALALAPDLPTLILFAHPHCPCTRATIHEFDGLLATLPQRVAATIVFTLPSGVPPHWEEGDQWRSATEIPGVRVITDREGREAQRFGVKGSGHVLLYEPSGALVFSGGITPSRGHEGDNPGRSAVIDLVNSGHAVVQRTPVYGCPLLETPPSTL